MLSAQFGMRTKSAWQTAAKPENKAAPELSLPLRLKMRSILPIGVFIKLERPKHADANHSKAAMLANIAAAICMLVVASHELSKLIETLHSWLPHNLELIRRSE